MANFHFRKIFKLENLDTSEKMVLLALADHANAQGACFPSIGRLAKWTGMTPRGVQKVLRRLELAGFVKIIANGGRKGSNHYTLHLPGDELPASPELCSPSAVAKTTQGSLSYRSKVVPPKSLINRAELHAGTSRKANEPTGDTHEQAERAAINDDVVVPELFRFYARRFKAEAFVAASTLKPEQARAMLRLNLVTESQLRKASIQF